MTTTTANTFEYMLLSRLVGDCKFFLGNGNGYEGTLWANNVVDQIAKMKDLWNNLEVKPQWLDISDINKYETEMLAKLED